MYIKRWLEDSVEDESGEFAPAILGVRQSGVTSPIWTIPGIGIINATAIYSAIGDGVKFNNAIESVGKHSYRKTWLQ